MCVYTCIIMYMYVCTCAVLMHVRVSVCMCACMHSRSCVLAWHVFVQCAFVCVSVLVNLSIVR